MIEVANLTKRFGAGETSSTVLDDVSLSVARGQIAAVIGPSGAGKSTLARCVNRLERPTSGTIHVAGQDLSALGERELQRARRTIGTIFQSSSLLMRRTATGNVSLPLEVAGIDRATRQARVRELLERVGLSHRADAYPRQLSGGERQRVSIARALALEPQILLSDEATSALDPGTTRSILDLLQQLRDDLGLTILLITHEMSVVRRIADHATLLDHGRAIESGLVRDLISDPGSRLGRGLLHEGEAIGASAGESIWHVTYARAGVPGDWLTRLSAELGGPVSLLGGTVEAIGGRAAGRLTIATAHGGERIPEIVAPWGLLAEPVDVSDHEPAFVSV